MQKPRGSVSRALGAGVWLLPCLWFAGCMGHLARITSARDAIPVSFLPAHLVAEPRGGKIPLDFTLLSQRAPQTPTISPGDTLGIYLQGMEGATQQGAAQDDVATALSLTINGPSARLGSPSLDPSKKEAELVRSNPYPVTGLIHAPLVGLPVIVSDDGSIPLPLVGPLPVARLTLSQAAEAVRRAYTVDRKIIQPGQDRTIVTLIKPRVHRVIVIRDDLDSSSMPSYYNAGLVTFTKLGSSIVLDLPAYENDVLHALIATGGLPGIDAENEIVVLRGDRQRPTVVEDASQPGTSASMPQARTALHIPLMVNPGELAPFSQRDIILEDGDILHVRTREAQVFYTGGLLTGERIPLPRDRDIDAMDAIALATGSPGGYPGDNSSLFRSLNGAGGIIKPTRVIVVRSLPNGEQVKIAVDLNRSASHAESRLVIQPNDFVLLEYKPAEFVGNAALGLLHVNFFFSNLQTTNAQAVSTTQGGQNAIPPPESGGGAAGTP